MADGTVYIDTALDTKSLEMSIKKTEAQLDRLIEKQIRFTETGGNTNSRTFKGMEYDIEQARNKLETLNAAQERSRSGTTMLQNAVNGLKRAFANAGPNILKTAGNLAKMTGNAMVKGVKKLGTCFKNLGKKILGVGKNTKGSHRSMLKMLASSILIGLAFRALMAIMNGLKSGINNLSQYSSETNKHMSALKSSLTQLKNSFATAFAPILSVVTPILTSFMNTISEVVNRIGMLVAALTGKGTFTKAVAVQEDYAAGLSHTADAAKDAEKAQNSYLSGLDEINRYESDKSGSSGGGSSSGVPVSEMFEEVAIDDSIVNLAEILREKIEAGDWKGVGMILAEKINGVFSEIDFYALGENFGEKVKNILDVIIGFLEGINWQMIGKKAADFIAGVDWSGIVNRLSEGMGAALGALGGLLWGFIKPAWDSVVKWWKETAYEDGQFTVDGLLEGIWDAICGIGTWIKENIFEPFIKGFKKAFGINSPSTVMIEMGKFLIQGLINGIGAKITEVINKLSELKTKILEKFSEIKNNLVSKYESMKKDASNFVQNVKDKIVSTFDSLKERISKIWSNIVKTIKGYINSVIGAINGMISGIVSGMNSIIKALNKLSFTVPEWLKYVPGASNIAGKKFGFNISTISAPKIPYLATGAVIPPNAPFMAVLGDQKQGTNIETPEALLRKIIREENANQRGTGGTYTFIGQINRRIVFEEVIAEAKVMQMITGKNPFELA